MKGKLFVVLLLLSVVSCTKNQSKDDVIDNKTVKIRVPDNWVYTAQDSLFSNIDFIPLETTPECLISYIRDVKFKDSLIFINENRRRLLVFNDKGKFKYEIGRVGEGPGEHLDVRDFFITNENTIELLDFTKIECYSLTGKHLWTKKFDFLGEDIYCNARNFISSPLGGYYFWGGLDKHLSMEKRDKNPLLLYVDNSMKIKNTYFAIGRGDGGALNRFFYYDNKIVLVPYSADYNVFQFDTKGNVSVRYRVDFGEKGLPTPLDLRGLGENERAEKITSMNNYVLDISHFFETDGWVYIRFSYKNYGYNILYSKQEKRTYMTTATDAKYNLEEFRHWYMNRPWNDKFTMVIEASWFKMEMDRLSPAAFKKYNLDRFKSVREDGNPVVVIYTMK